MSHLIVNGADKTLDHIKIKAVVKGLSEPLCGINTYKDTLELSTGTLTRYVKKLVLTGQETNWGTYTLQDSRYCAYLPISNFKGASDSGIVADLICSHYAASLQNSIYNGNNKTCIGGRTNQGILITDTNISDETTFKTYLQQQYAAGTPVTVWYVLATPEVETVTVPSGLTGNLEGYLTQSGTTTPSTPIYPTANGEEESGGTYSIDTGEYIEAWEARDKNDHLLWGRADTFTGTNSISARCYGLPVKSWEIDGNGQQDSGTITIPSKNVTVISIESGTNYAMFLKSDFPDVAVGDKVNIVVSGTTHSLNVKKSDTQYVYVENEAV